MVPVGFKSNENVSSVELLGVPLSLHNIFVNPEAFKLQSVEQVAGAVTVSPIEQFPETSVMVMLRLPPEMGYGPKFVAEP